MDQELMQQMYPYQQTMVGILVAAVTYSPMAMSSGTSSTKHYLLERLALAPQGCTTGTTSAQLTN